MKLSIVIRCGREWGGLQRCLKSIDQPVEVVVSAAAEVKKEKITTPAKGWSASG
ncbi:MAG: hypothetical protein U0946_02035 [Patescibacteria group bacterium]|nr:hypothetical protein [Patescibacteria group bacterium]